MNTTLLSFRATSGVEESCSNENVTCYRLSKELEMEMPVGRLPHLGSGVAERILNFDS